MIDKMVKEVDGLTLEKKKVVGSRKLIIVKTDDSIGNKMYLRSIIKKGEYLGIEVVVKNYSNLEYGVDVNKEDFYQIYKTESGQYDYKVKVLILKPYNKCSKAKVMYDEVLKFTSDLKNNIEPKGVQIPTISAINKIVNKVGTQKNILIVNRSENLGRPLADVLLDSDHTVSIAHTKTKSLENLISNSNIVVLATGSNLNDIYLKDENITWIDVSGDLSLDNLGSNYIKHVGKLTTSYLFYLLFE